MGKHGVKGYPTIKYGDPDDLKDYDGGRDFASLKKFAEENLGPVCGPDNLDLCDDEAKAFIAKLQKMELAELDKLVTDSDASIAKIDAKATTAVQKLEDKISALEKEIEAETKKKDKAVADMNKKLGLSMARKVSSSKKKAELGEKKKKKDKKKGKKEL